jgi:hypothetical protein
MSSSYAYDRDSKLPPGFSHWEPMLPSEYKGPCVWGYQSDVSGFYAVTSGRHPQFNPACDYYIAILKPGYSIRVGEKGKVSSEQGELVHSASSCLGVFVDNLPANELERGAEKAGLGGDAEKVFVVSDCNKTEDLCEAMRKSSEEPSLQAPRVMTTLQYANAKKLSLRETSELILVTLYK